MKISARHKRTLETVFADPVPATIEWNEVTALMRALGARIKEREGSRVVFIINKSKLIIHRPHPRKELGKGAVESLKIFLRNNELTP